MKNLDVQTLTLFANGHHTNGAKGYVSRVVTDSRKVAPGDLFVALKGEKFDAHDYLSEVVASGATACLVQRGRGTSNESCAMIEVDDTLTGLQDLARGYRSILQPRIVALTGSNGKTSTKDLTAAIMSCKFKTHATQGNLNNHIGVPLTLLSLEEEHECGIVEMGMNHAGEIKVLVDIALPDAAIVTNIGMAHIEYLGTQDAIAWEKGTLPSNIPADGIVVLNANDKYSDLIARHCQANVYRAGMNAGDVRAFDLKTKSNGTAFKLDFSGEIIDAFLPVMGEHMVGNAALAACMGWAHGISPTEIAEALNKSKLTGGRMETKTFRGIQFIDDSYNANPDSMKAGLTALASLSNEGHRIAILGQMGELGHHAIEGHRSVGRHAAQLKIDAVFTVGGEASLISDEAKAGGLCESLHFASQEACAAHLKRVLKPGDAVLLKGSRSAGMEKVLTHYLNS